MIRVDFVNYKYSSPYKYGYGMLQLIILTLNVNKLIN